MSNGTLSKNNDLTEGEVSVGAVRHDLHVDAEGVGRTREGLDHVITAVRTTLLVGAKVWTHSDHQVVERFT